MDTKNNIKLPQVSVIVPVYNTAKYLKRCVESIAGQTYTALEIILVDDGSTDQSPELCDTLAKQDQRIYVIHQKNQGVARARICGTKVAHGEYLTFVDSDDYISSNMIEAMIDTIITEKADLVVCQMNKVERNRIISFPEKPSHGVYNRKELENLLREKGLYDMTTHLAGISWEMCGKLYPRTALSPYLANGLGLWYEEDMVIFFSYLYHTKKMVVLPNRFYQYVCREGQATQIYRPDMVHNLKLTMKKLTELDDRQYLDKQLPLRVLIEVSRLLSICIQNQKKLFFKKAFKEITDDDFIMGKLSLVKEQRGLSDKIKKYLLTHKYENLYYIMVWTKHKLKG